MNFILIQSIYSILSTLLIIKYSKYIGEKLNLIDRPSNKNIHNSDVPLTGGFILINLFLSTEILLYFEDILATQTFIYLFIFNIIFFIIGLLDDLNNVSGSKRTLFFFLASSLFIYLSNFYLDLTKVFFIFNKYTLNIGLLNILFFSLAIAGLQIVFNLIDGVNGLLKIYFVISLIILDIDTLGNISLMTKIIFIPLLIMIFYNYQNKFFLGSSGNSVLSFIMSFILLSNLTNHSQPLYFEEIFLLFFIPFIDCLRLFCYRLNKFKNIFIKQKNHLHHYLIQKYPLKTTLIIYFAISFLPLLIYYILKLNIYVVLLVALSVYLVLLNFLKENSQK